MERKRTLLIVDDAKLNREILKNMLCDDYDIIEAEHGKEAIAVMTAEFSNISAVLLDLGMPIMDGYEVLSYVQSVDILKQLPIIVTTSQTDNDSEEKALRLGAKDYITKPYKSAIIRQRILNTIILRETSATVNAMQRDRLTGLYSRDAFFEKIRSTVAAHEPGYYIMSSFDVEKFKVINDQYGNEKGDEALRHIASVFREGFESSGGFCCRISADDFAAFYPTKFCDSEKLDEIRRKASLIRGISTPIAFTIGRYVVEDKTMLPSAMYDRAILAANSIKGRYDVRIAVYDESMRCKLIEEQRIVSEMESALANNQFEIWYQPQYNHASGALIGAEALIRWNHPQKGLISPGVFIPIFEQSGFIYKLDKYVWEGVCKYLREEISAGHSPLPISVNISRYDVFRPDFIDFITGLIGTYNLPVELLRLEITESAFSENTKHIVSVVKELIDFGFTLEIDDFGSGYSSLNTLKSVPAQVVKLDMRFFEGDDDSERGGNIIESVVRMTKWLGMSIIAEGVEDIEQADYLKSIGCNYIQGYLYSKPIRESDYRSLCDGAGKEEKLLVLETVDNLDNNSFWNPKSMDTLIFNSYVGSACIFEYTNGNIELLRVSSKYVRTIEQKGINMENVLKLDWAAHLNSDGRAQLHDSLIQSKNTHNDVAIELTMTDIPNFPDTLYLRFNLRVIATAGSHYLVYCIYENITEQRKAEQHDRIVTEQMQSVLDNVACGITAVKMDGNTITFLIANDKFFNIIGYTKEQYDSEIGIHIFNIIYPDDAGLFSDAMHSVIQTDSMRTIEYRVKHRNGNIIWLRSNISMAFFDSILTKVQISTFIDITEQKKSEFELLNTTMQIRTMMDDMPGGFARILINSDGSTKTEYINSGLCRLTGMTHDEIISLFKKDMFSRIHPGDVANVKEAIKKILKNGEAYSAQYRLLHKDGRYVWTSILGRSTVDASGNTYLNLYYTDTSEKVTEEERQKELLDNLPYGAALYEYDGTHLSVIHINNRYWELVGRKKTEYSDSTFINAIYSDDRSSVLNELSLAVKENRLASCDIRIRYGESEYRPFHISGQIVQIKNGKYAIYAAYTPISDEVMSVQEMLPIALGAMMNSQSDYMFVKDKNLHYICCSMPVVKAMGLSSESEIIGKSDRDLFEKTVAEKFYLDDMHILETGESIIDIVSRIPSEDGSELYSCTSKFPLRNVHGNIVGVYGIGRDVTETRSIKSRFELLSSSIPGGIATYEYENGKLILTYFNDGFCRLFEMPYEEYKAISSDNPLLGICDEDLPKLQSQIDSLICDNSQIDCSYRIRLKNGAVKWINLKAGVSERFDNKVTFNAVLFDITQQQNSIEKMRISEEENRLAIQHTQNTVCRYYVDSGTLVVPERVKDIFSFPGEIINVPDSQTKSGLISPDTAGSYTEFYNRIRQGQKTGSVVFKRMSRSGWRWIEGHFSTIFSADNKPVSAVISFNDVTSQIEKDIAYRRWRQSISDKDSETYSLYRYNLTDDKYIGEHEGSLIAPALDPALFSFHDYAEKYITQHVSPDDAERVADFLNPDILLSKFYQGIHMLSLDYKESLQNNNIKWVRLTVDMVDLTCSTDIEAYLLFEDIDREKKLELATIEQAATDPLTGVLNRNSFMTQVNKIIQSSESGTNHAFMMLDMDGFKKVNDAFGHKVGDKAIVDIADAIRSVVGPQDLIGRLGGDEFLVFIPMITEDTVAAAKAQQLCAIARKAYSVEVEISCSIGIAVTPRDGMDFETLYRKADSALYHVKGTGKNSYAFYSDDIADEHFMYQDTDTPSVISHTYKKRRMLIVDDSRIDHAMLSNIFSNDFIIEKARDGNAALIGLHHYGAAISVVLLDLMMPKMDGFTVLKKLREVPELQNIPVIVVSGDENRETSLRAIREGAVDFVSKPVDPEILKIRVQSAISRSENDRLRAKNSALEFQNSEIIRYKTALESSETFVIENDWVSGTFIYDKSVSEYIAGTYDNRGFWRILLSDFVAETVVVQKMQNMVQFVASDRNKSSEKAFVQLKAPDNTKHWFRLNVQKKSNDFGLTGKVYLVFTDHGTDAPDK